MKYARELYSNALWHEIQPLLVGHHAETASKVYGSLSPDKTFYEKAASMLRIFTMRQERVLVGYQIYFILGDPHSQGRVQAVQDILYVAPGSRKGLAGYRFMNWCVTQLSEEVDVVMQRIPAHNDFGHLLERMGFRLEDLTYAMEI